MLFYRKQLLDRYPSTYLLNKAMDNNEIYKVQNGIYSNERFNNPLEILKVKYPNAIFTLDSAFYFYDLTDVIPDKFYLATKRSATRIDDDGVKQVFVPDELFEIGKCKMIVENVEVSIYDKERLLVELIRRRNKLPFDYYKEIILNYRKIVNELDIYKIEEYISYYKNDALLYEILQREVF